MVCLTDRVPQGLYDFEAWAVSSTGTGLVGWQPAGAKPVLMVEEMGDDYAAAFGDDFMTMASTFVKATGREVTYTKKSDATLLKVTLSDTLRVAYNQSSQGHVAITMDGEYVCTVGKFTDPGPSATGNFHTPLVVTCIVDKPVPRGDHVFDVRVRSGAPGTAPVGEVRLGWGRPQRLLLVEEISRDGVSYAVMNQVIGELQGDWSAVGGRLVIRDVSAAAKTVKFTYSDTFRANNGCSGAGGFFQLYVDQVPTGCMNGVYSSITGKIQNHFLPINLTCVVPGITPGRHVFSVYQTTWTNGVPASHCGSNNFGGFDRSQALLLVEELP